MTASILLVEDEKDVRDLMSLHLGREGYHTTAVEHGEEALRLLKNQECSFDIVVLDWMLPGLSGLEICKNIRSGSLGGVKKQVPVLMVTARADTSDIVLGLEIGADDYITKPFDIPVFLARIRALIRRAHTLKAGPQSKVQIGDLSIDTEAHEVNCAGQKIHLTPSEFKLLYALMSNQGRVLSRDKLIDLVQGEGVMVVDRAIDTHMFGLRKKLGACATNLETIRGIGYRIKST